MKPPDRFKRQPQLDIPIVHELYEGYKLLHDTVKRFPKQERYSLGQTCSATLLSILQNVLTASQTRDGAEKAKMLKEASTKLDIFKILIRLAKDCDCIQNTHYLKLQSKLNTVGKMLGGWIRSLT